MCVLWKWKHVCGWSRNMKTKKWKQLLCIEFDWDEVLWLFLASAERTHFQRKFLMQHVQQQHRQPPHVRETSNEFFHRFALSPSFCRFSVPMIKRWSLSQLCSRISQMNLFRSILSSLSYIFQCNRNIFCFAPLCFKRARNFFSPLFPQRNEMREEFACGNGE